MIPRRVQPLRTSLDLLVRARAQVSAEGQLLCHSLVFAPFCDENSRPRSGESDGRGLGSPCSTGASTGGGAGWGCWSLSVMLAILLHNPADMHHYRQD